MKKDALQGAEKYTKAHQREKRWYRVVTVLACVVVFCTVYALILPAITMEKGACEIPEHTHSEACYTQVTSATRTEPVCTIESLNLHQHDDTCYDSEGNLVNCWALDRQTLSFTSMIRHAMTKMGTFGAHCRRSRPMSTPEAAMPCRKQTHPKYIPIRMIATPWSAAN